ncbi:MAG: hypothetical protein H6625_07810 [Bdellovibrionaceae bacterium]|nr:hypothetical protein [Pseudobdellovibrionaceae bacterium]
MKNNHITILILVLIHLNIAFGEESLKFSETTQSEQGIQEVRNLMGMNDNNVSFMDRDIRVFSDNKNTVELVGEGCLVEIESKKQLREQDGKKWAVLSLDVSVITASNNKLSFLSEHFVESEKEKLVNNGKTLRISQSLFPVSARKLHQRGYYTYEEYINKESGGSPEGEMGWATLTEGWHYFTGGIFRSYFDQSVEFQMTETRNIQAVLISVKDKKLKCSGIQN